MVIGNIAKDYPQVVYDQVMPLMAAACIDYKNNILDLEVLEEMLCDIALKKYFASNEEDAKLEWSDVEESLTKATVTTLINSMISRGLLDTISGEDGVEIVWVTSKGKEYIINHTITQPSTEGNICHPTASAIEPEELNELYVFKMLSK